MNLVDYVYRLPYRRLPGNEDVFPALDVQISFGENIIDVLSILDTGATRSVFSGDIALALGIDIADGHKVKLASIGGAFFVYSHTVSLKLLDLSFETNICFPERKLNRNLIGRDILGRIQVGFREHYSEMFISTVS